MKKQLSIEDWQALSVYLDDNLLPKEKSRLEARLSSDAGLQEALDELRRTRIILRNSPRIKVPRNFTLTREMVGLKQQEKTAKLYPVFKFATVIASVLFVFALLGDFFIKQPSQMAAIPEMEMVASQESVEKPAPQLEMAAVPTATDHVPTEIRMKEEAEEKGAELSNAPIEPLPSTMPSVMKMEPTEITAEIPLLAAAPEEINQTPSEAIPPAAEGLGGMGASMEDTSPPRMAEPATEEYSNTAEGPIQAPETGITPKTSEEGLRKVNRGIDIWGIFEIVFGGLVIISGILAVVFRPMKIP